MASSNTKKQARYRNRHGRMYPDQKVAMAGHATLWNEHNADRKVTNAHLVLLAKDGSGARTHSFGELQNEWEIFQLWLKAWRLEKGVERTQARCRASSASRNAAIRSSCQVTRTSPR
jgi:hypothetical protein